MFKVLLIKEQLIPLLLISFLDFDIPTLAVVTFFKYKYIYF